MWWVRRRRCYRKSNTSVCRVYITVTSSYPYWLYYAFETHRFHFCSNESARQDKTKRKAWTRSRKIPFSNFSRVEKRRFFLMIRSVSVHEIKSRFWTWLYSWTPVRLQFNFDLERCELFHLEDDRCSSMKYGTLANARDRKQTFGSFHLN